jgi:hypothetical protein
MYKTHTYDDPEKKPSMYEELEENEVFTPGYDEGVFKQVGIHNEDEKDIKLQHKIDYKNIQFINPYVDDANDERDLIQALLSELKLEKSREIRKKKNKEVKRRTRKFNMLMEKAREIDIAVRSIISLSDSGLDVDSSSFNLENEKDFNPLKEISNWAEGSIEDQLFISIRIEEIKNVSGKTINGSTEGVKHDNMLIGFRIKINPSSINKDWSLANEIGDVYFQTVLGDSEYSKQDIRQIKKEKRRNHFSTDQEAHDNIYWELNSTLFSFEIEALYKQGLKKMEKQ